MKFTGYPIDDAARLYGDEIIQSQKIHKTCKKCSQIEKHNPYFCDIYYPKIGATIPEEKCIPSAKWFWSIQSKLQILFNVATGLPYKDWIYTIDNNNFMQNLGNFYVEESDENYVILYNENIDPRTCVPEKLIENPDWPLSGPRYIPDGSGGGSLQPFDYMLIGGGGALGNRGVRTYAISYEYLGNKYFKVYTPINTKFANPTNKLMERGEISFWRRFASMPLWDDVYESVPFYATYVETITDTKPIIELDDLMYPDKFKIEIGLTDVSDRIKSEKRLYVASGYKTKIYLGSKNWNGLSQEDITGYGKYVKLSYYKYNKDSKYIVGQRICKHVKYCNRMKNWGTGIVNHGDYYSAYCEKRNTASEITHFSEKCYLYHCSGFEELDETLGRDSIIKFFDNVYFAQDAYLLQDTEGMGLFYLLTSKHPSILQLLGHYKPETPVIATIPKRINLHNGIFGYKIFLSPTIGVRNFKGGIHENNFTYGDLEVESGEEAVKYSFEENEDNSNCGRGGLIYCGEVDEYLTKKDRYDWSKNENVYHQKALPYFQKGGYRQNTISVGGQINECEQQRGGEILTNAFCSILKDETVGQNYQTKMELGSWNDLLQPDENGDWGLKITVNSGLPQGNHPVIVSGFVYKAERIDSSTVKIHCYLVPKALIKSEYGETIARTYMSGGNIVELPDWMKDNNFYSFNLFHSNQKAQPGHAFYCVIAGQGRKWTISECYPCSGDTQSYIPQTINSVTPFKVPSISTSLDVPFAVVVKRGSPYVKLYFACLSYCSTCKKETKWKLHWTKNGDYPISYSLDNWKCCVCDKTVSYSSFYPDKPNIDITGIPPGRHTIHDGRSKEEALTYELAQDEWSLKQVYDESGNIHHYEIFFSPFIVNHLLDDGDIKNLLIYYNQSSIKSEDFNVLDNWLDFEISKDHYESLSTFPGDCYFKIFDNNGNLVKLEETHDPDLRNWWDNTGETDLRYSYQPFEVDSKYFIRFHFDFGGKFGQLYWRKQPVPGQSSSDYYDWATSGMHGLYPTHKTWACKSDVLYINDHGELSDVKILEDTEFTISNNSVVHDFEKDGYPVYLKITEREKDEWTEILHNNYKIHYALGTIFVKKDALTNYSGKDFCIKLENLRLNNNSGYLTARHFNETKTIIDNIKTCETTISGDHFEIDASQYTQVVAENVLFNNECCPNPLFYSDYFLGLRRSWINEYFNNPLSETEIIGVDEPVTISHLGKCGSTDFDNSDTGIENVCLQWTNSGTVYSFMAGVWLARGIFGLDPLEGTKKGGYAIMTGFQMQSRPFNLNQLDSLPVGAIINKAVIKITATNVKHYGEVYEYGNVDGAIVETNHDYIMKEECGVTIIIFGRTVDGAINVISGKGIHVFENGAYYDITDCVKDMQKAINNAEIEYAGFNISIIPLLEDVDIFHSGSEIFNIIRSASHKISYAYHTDPDNPCGSFWYCDYQETAYITFDGFSVGDMYIEFELPDMSNQKVTIGNIPSFGIIEK